MKQTKGIYQSADGKLWRDPKLCKQHDAWLELAEVCAVLAEGLLGVPTEEAAEQLAVEIVSEGEELARILRANPLKDGGELPVDEPEDGGTS